MSDSDLYGDDIRLWSERQGALLRQLAAGQAVSEQVDWPHVVEEIEDLGHSEAQPVQDEIAHLTARLAAAETLVKDLRARLDTLTGKLAETHAELASIQNQVETATARAVAAAESGHAASRSGRGQGRWQRLRTAWRGQ